MANFKMKIFIVLVYVFVVDACEYNTVNRQLFCQNSSQLINFVKTKLDVNSHVIVKGILSRINDNFSDCEPFEAGGNWLAIAIIITSVLGNVSLTIVINKKWIKQQMEKLCKRVKHI